MHDESKVHPAAVQQLNISELRNENSSSGGLQVGRGSGNADEEDEAMEDYDDEDDEDEDEDDEDLQEEKKLGYKIKFEQRHNAAGPLNDGGNGTATHLHRSSVLRFPFKNSFSVTFVGPPPSYLLLSYLHRATSVKSSSAHQHFLC